VLELFKNSYGGGGSTGRAASAVGDRTEASALYVTSGGVEGTLLDPSVGGAVPLSAKILYL